MSIKSSQTLVQEAQKNIETLTSNEVKKLHDSNEITLIDVRDIRELWKEGTIERSKHIPRGMLEFWLDPSSTYYQSNKIQDIKKKAITAAQVDEMKKKLSVMTHNVSKIFNMDQVEILQVNIFRK